MTPTHNRRSDDRGKPAEEPTCPSCGAVVLLEARFCHACGASFAQGPADRKWSSGRLTTLGAAAGLIVVAAFTVVVSERGSDQPPSSAPPSPMFSAPSVASIGGPPDLSRMTPREAADRLFNRIMMASEQGNRAEALRFVPMAVQAYGSLPTLDRDALYHLGLIHGVAGDRAKVDEQIAALRRGAPDHLLALVLEHDAAERSGDRAAVSRILAAFDAAYDAEIAKGRPEYEAHFNVIERFRAAAARSDVEPVRGSQEGAVLFAANCASCHGPAANGSDKGPPLVDKIYEPSHHDDGSFYRAVLEGVRAHHWQFGDMAPVPGVSEREIGQIIAYVRERQRAAGIE